MGSAELPDWERLLSAERHLQALVPGSVLVGGTAAALAARGRHWASALAAGLLGEGTP